MFSYRSTVKKKDFSEKLSQCAQQHKNVHFSFLKCTTETDLNQSLGSLVEEWDISVQIHKAVSVEGGNTLPSSNTIKSN